MNRRCIPRPKGQPVQNVADLDYGMLLLSMFPRQPGMGGDASLPAAPAMLDCALSHAVHLLLACWRESHHHWPSDPAHPLPFLPLPSPSLHPHPLPFLLPPPLTLVLLLEKLSSSLLPWEQADSWSLEQTRSPDLQHTSSSYVCLPCVTRVGVVLGKLLRNTIYCSLLHNIPTSM